MQSNSDWPFGLHAWEPGHGLVELRVVDTEEQLVSSWFSPTNEEIRRACAEHQLDSDYILHLIQNGMGSTHTLVIDAVVFRHHHPINHIND